MIVELLFTIFIALVRLAIALIPTGAAPAWFSDVGDAYGVVWSYGSGLSAWLPWSTLAQSLGAMLAAVGIAFGIRVVRVVISFFTGGGGSAA